MEHVLPSCFLVSPGFTASSSPSSPVLAEHNEQAGRFRSFEMQISSACLLFVYLSTCEGRIAIVEAIFQCIGYPTWGKKDFREVGRALDMLARSQQSGGTRVSKKT